jgi:hypothetical protein
MENQAVILQGNSVRLEPLSFEHLDALCAAGFDESIWRWTTTQVTNASQMKRYIEVALEEQQKTFLCRLSRLKNLPALLSVQPDSEILTGTTGESKSAGRGSIRDGSERESTRKQNF